VEETRRPPIDTSSKDWILLLQWQDQKAWRRAFNGANDSFRYGQLQQQYVSNIVSALRCCQVSTIFEHTVLCLRMSPVRDTDLSKR
jgi:hypothetical protein